MPVAGAGSHTLEDAPICVPLLPITSTGTTTSSTASTVQLLTALCTAQLLPLHTPGPFPFVLKCQSINFISYCPFLGICESEASSFFLSVQLCQFWVQLLGHILPSLLPSYRHSPKFTSLFVPDISSSCGLGMQSPLLYHFSLVMAPHLCHPTLRGQSRNQTVSKHTYLPLTVIKGVGREKQTSANFTTRENEPEDFVTESKDANSPSPKNGYVDCAASL